MPQANSMEVQSVTVKRSLIGTVWRWRTEMAVVMAAAYCSGLLYGAVGLAGLVWVAGINLAGWGLIPWNRRFIVRRFWCVVTRHRLQTVFWELRLHTRAYRLPLVLWVRPTPVGERAWVVLRAGLCPADFEKTTDEIATACNARESRVTGSRRVKSLIQIDVIRRDLLAPGKIILSQLATSHVPAVAAPDWLALPDAPAPETGTAPVPSPARWPDTGPEGEDW